MKNIVGQTPRGDNFFPRDAVINKIYRRLEAGNHIYMSAPRRAGKTAIMRHMEDHPREGFACLYISVEDVNDSEEFFQVLSEELLNSKAVSRLIKISENAQGIFSRFAEHIKKIKVWNVELETQTKERPQYSSEFEKLTRNLDTSDFRIVLLIDEFPIALERIAKDFSTKDAVEFLHINRTIRQRAKQGLQFIYTGSIGLPNIAEKLDSTATINDLNVVEVPPLTLKEAKEFTRLLMKSYNIKTNPRVVEYMLKRLHWLMPFFIQLIVQMLIDEYEMTQEPISKEVVDLVIEKASNHRNNIYFESYYSRLDKSLTKEESDLAKIILSEIAIKDRVPINAFDELDSASSLLDILEFDGYINSMNKAYSFNSPILQLWWKKHVSK